LAHLIDKTCKIVVNNTENILIVSSDSMLTSLLPLRRQVIQTFATRTAAGQAADHLILSGVPISRIFLVGDGSQRLISPNPAPAVLSIPAPGTVTGTPTGLKQGMVMGNLIGGTTGLLLGVGLAALPGVGQLALSGVIAFTLLSGGVCTAAGGLMGALIGLGLSSEQVKRLDGQVAKGRVLLLVEGTAQDITHAHQLLQKRFLGERL
jgi:hypothetical protein